METYTFTKKEEIAHAITHGIGALLSIAALVLLIVFSSLNGDTLQVISGIVFGTTILFMYLSSTIVHSLPEGKWKNIFQLFDHSFIYILIVRCYRPIVLLPLQGDIGLIICGIIWGIAIAGVIFMIFFFNRFLILTTLLNILLGWLIIFIWKPLTNLMHV